MMWMSIPVLVILALIASGQVDLGMERFRDDCATVYSGFVGLAWALFGIAIIAGFCYVFYMGLTT